MSAKALIDKLNADKIKEHEGVLLLTTGLSQAFDLVDHKTLLER